MARLFFVFTGLRDPGAHLGVARFLRRAALWLPPLTIVGSIAMDLTTPFLQLLQSDFTFASAPLTFRIILLAGTAFATGWMAVMSGRVLKKIDQLVA